MKIEFRRERSVDQRGGDCVITTARRWVRLAAYYGQPPGSHIGYWSTRLDDDFRGANLRIGRRIKGPALTLFVHTRPVRGAGPGGADPKETPDA